MCPYFYSARVTNLSLYGFPTQVLPWRVTRHLSSFLQLSDIVALESVVGHLFIWPFQRPETPQPYMGKARHGRVCGLLAQVQFVSLYFWLLQEEKAGEELPSTLRLCGPFMG